MTVFFTPTDWYYEVKGDAGNVYSSARGMFMPITDANYQAWLKGPENAVTPADTQAEIGAALAPYKVTIPIDPGVLAGFQEARLEMAQNDPTFMGWYDHENRILVLEGQPPLDIKHAAEKFQHARP